MKDRKHFHNYDLTAFCQLLIQMIDVHESHLCLQSRLAATVESYYKRRVLRLHGKDRQHGDSSLVQLDFKLTIDDRLS